MLQSIFNYLLWRINCEARALTSNPKKRSVAPFENTACNEDVCTVLRYKSRIISVTKCFINII